MACDRDGVFEEYDHKTPWEFHIMIYEDDNHTKPISDAEIFIYKSEEDRTNNANVFLKGKSDSNGELVFTASDFGATEDKPDIAKGFYYLKVKKGGVEVDEVTRYLLMNDGHTYQNIILKN